MAYPIVRCTCVLLLLFAAFGALVAARTQQPPSSAADVAEIKLFVHRADNEWIEVPKEIGVSDSERNNAISRGNCRAAVNVVRILSGKAKIRFKKDDVIELLMKTPDDSGPGAMELLQYDNRGKQRQAYLTCFNGPEGIPDFSEQPFKGARVSNTEWRLRPSAPLPPGEYCFKVRATNVNFCFGVDKK